MSPLVQIGTLVIQTLGSLYLLIIILRFLFQLVRADFYNPVSQFAVKATNPLLIPLRKIIPGVFGIDVASLVLAVIIHYLIIQLNAFLFGLPLLNPLHVVMWSIIGLLSLTATIYFWGLIIMVIASWVAPQSHHPLLLLVRQLVDPVAAPFQRLIPPIGGLDISIIFVFLSIKVAQIIIVYLAQVTTLPIQLTIGF